MGKRRLVTRIQVEDDEVQIEWDANLGKLASGHPIGADYKKNRIRVAAGTRHSVKREHIVHELLHKLWEKSGLTKHYSNTTEEVVITSLTGWLVEVLRDNPELVEFLTEEG